jgi:hypothetical protein
MLVSAVSALVVVLLMSEVPERLMNHPVYGTVIFDNFYCIRLTLNEKRLPRF